MIMMFVSEVFVYTVSFLSVTGVLGTYHYTLVLMGIFAVLPDIVTKVVQAKIQYLALDRLQETSRVKKYFQDLLTHLDYNKEIRVYHTKEYFLKKWNEKNEEYNGERRKLIRYHLKVSLICNGISFLSMAGSLVLVIFLVWQKKIGIAEFAAIFFKCSYIIENEFLTYFKFGDFCISMWIKGKILL